jgi:hypothetical protein
MSVLLEQGGGKVIVVVVVKHPMEPRPLKLFPKEMDSPLGLFDGMLE